VNKPTHDETPCPLTKENVKGHCLGVVAIVGMSLRLVSYDRGRLAHDETTYSLWENKEILLLLFFFPEVYEGRIIYSLRVRDGVKKCKDAKQKCVIDSLL
jgi:hypothetical protein